MSHDLFDKCDYNSNLTQLKLRLDHAVQMRNSNERKTTIQRQHKTDTSTKYKKSIDTKREVQKKR